jgi:hypothetical protein
MGVEKERLEKLQSDLWRRLVTSDAKWAPDREEIVAELSEVNGNLRTLRSEPTTTARQYRVDNKE